MQQKSADKIRSKKRKWLARIRSVLAYAVIFLVLGWGIDLWRAQSMVTGSAPELLAQSVQNQPIDLHEMSMDKPVLVYFWATWCGVCRVVSPSVDWLDDDYQVITIALSSGDNRRIKQYLQAKGYDFTVINDAKGKVSRDWGISVTPTLFVIDKGDIRSVTTGFTSPLGIWFRLLLS